MTPMESIYGDTFAACDVCMKANEEKIAAGIPGPFKVPVLVQGGPEAQPCEHLADWVRRNEQKGATP